MTEKLLLSCLFGVLVDCREVGGAWWALGRLAFAGIAELGRDYGLEGSDSKRQRKL